MSKYFIAISRNRKPFEYVVDFIYSVSIDYAKLTTTPDINIAHSYENRESARKAQGIINKYWDELETITLHGTKEFLEEEITAYEKMFEKGKNNDYQKEKC